MDKGVNNNVNITISSNQAQTGGPDPRRATAQEKIIIDFRAMQRDSDEHHLSVDEVLRSQVDEYMRTGALPEGKTLAEFLMDVQNAVEKYAGKDKQLNIDEYQEMVDAGVQMSRPSERSQGVYSEWAEVDENGNVSHGAEYSPRAEANQKQIDEVAEMKKQAAVDPVRETKQQTTSIAGDGTLLGDVKQKQQRLETLKQWAKGPDTPENHAKIEAEINQITRELNELQNYYEDSDTN